MFTLGEGLCCNIVFTLRMGEGCFKEWKIHREGGKIHLRRRDRLGRKKVLSSLYIEELNLVSLVFHSSSDPLNILKK